MIEAAVFDTKPYDREFLTRHDLDGKIRWRFHEFRLSTETAQLARGATVVCVFVNDRVDRACLEILAGLGVRLVALRCAGFNNVDLAAAKELKLPVTRVPAYSPHAVAEHTIGLLLALNRKIHRAFNRVREHNFALNGLVGFDLYGKTAGVIGTGKIGRIVAQILRGFETTVVAYDPFPTHEWAATHQVKYVSLNELLSVSDMVTLHVPLSAETTHLLRTETLAQMKRGAYLINTSRGKLIETRALIQALKRGQLGGVALDVYEEEEEIFFEDRSETMLLDDELSRLLTFPNVLITAHQAFLTHEALNEIARVTAENIGRLDSNAPFIAQTELRC
jgi:D-lactate dehydrogenase